MEAVIIIFVMALYVGVRVLLGGGETGYEKKLKKLKPGLELLKKKEYTKAFEYFDKKVAEDEQNAVALGLRAKCCYYLGDLENALIDAAKASIIDNSYPEPYLIKAKCLMDLADPQSALKEAEKAVWYCRNNPEAYMLLGTAWLKLGDLQKAEENLFTAYKLGEENALYQLPVQSKQRLQSFRKYL